MVNEWISLATIRALEVFAMLFPCADGNGNMVKTKNNPQVYNQQIYNFKNVNVMCAAHLNVHACVCKKLTVLYV